MKRFAAALWLCTLGCQNAQTKTSERSDAVLGSGQPQTVAANLYARDTLERAVKDVLGGLGPSAGILSIEIFPDHARFEVEASNTPGEVVEYDWRSGTTRGPTRLELRGKGSLQQNLFLASALDFASIPALVDTARTRIDAEQGKVSRVLVRRNLPADDSVGIRVYVDSPLKSSHVDADAHGHALDPGKYP